MEIDYKLKILGEKSVYLPRKEFIDPLINSNKKIFEITAGNGFGKTFLLNLFAYAFYADKLGNESILKTLKDRVSDYSNQEAYSLEYKLSFNLPNGKKINLSKVIGSERIVQIEDGPSIGANNLHKTVSILYDVPVDPSLRLNEVIKDLGLWNSRLKEKFLVYYKLLDKIENQFSNIRDEDKIKNLENAALKLKEELNAKLKSQNEKDELYNNLKSFSDLNKLIEDYKKIEKIQLEKFKKDNEFKICPKPDKIDKKDELLIKSLQAQLNEAKDKFKNSMLDLIKIITNQNDLHEYIINDISLNKHFIFLNETSIDKIINDDDNVKASNIFCRKLQYLEESVIDYINKEESGKKYIVHNFLKDLLEKIDELIENEADGILKILTKNDTNILKQEINNRIIEHKIVNYSSLKAIVKSSPNSVKVIIGQAIKLKEKIDKESKKKGIDSDGERYYKLKGELQDLNDRLTKTSKEIIPFKYKLASDLGISDSNLDTFQNASVIKSGIKSKFVDDKILENLPNEIIKASRDRQQISEQIEEIKKSALRNETLLSYEKIKIGSQYSLIEQDKIKKFKLRLQIIIKNIGDFNELISNIDDGDLDKFKVKEDVRFINVAGKIIAYSMDNKILRSDGKYIHLEYYDLKNKQFHCDGDVTIRKDDISTGLASANYLRQRIENVKGDYVIILLDEIGNMAQDTLTEVIKSIKKIEEQNRLIIAVLTQPSRNKEEILINEH
jgi:hypothetical protein